MVARSKKGHRSGGHPRRTTRSRKPPERHALVVLGMHRSGTSALAGMLGLAGASLPASLMPATDANPRGFFESQRLFELHEELLAELHTSWRDISPPPPGFSRSPEARQWVERLADAVEEEFGDAPLFVVKDPRICRIVPLWARVLERVHARPVYLLALRNPLDVASSLQHQHQIEEGAGLLLWLDHVIRSERDSRGQPRIVVSYESLLDDWRRVLRRAEQQLGIAFPRLSRGSEAEIDRFLTSSLRKQYARSSRLEEREDLADWIKQVYAWAVQADRGGDTSPEILDPIGDALIEAERAFGPVLASSQLAYRELRSETGALREALDDARQERNRRDEELGKARSELVVVRDETTQLREGLDDREQLLDNARQERNRRDEELSGVRSELVVARDEVTRLREGLDDRESQLDDTRQERNRSDRELATAHGELELSRGETARLRADLGDRHEQLEQLFDWVKVLLPWAAQVASGRSLSAETAGEILTALEAAAPAERASAATAGLRFAAQAARIEELEEDHRRQDAAKAELQRTLAELETGLAEHADAHAGELRALDRDAARLRAEFVVAVERAERREREIVEQAESHAAEVATIVASGAQIADERQEGAAQLAKAQADIADLELFVERLRLHQAAVEQSRTWRWSRPLRALAGKLHR